MDTGDNATPNLSRYVGEVSIEEGGIIPVSRAAATLGDLMKNETQRPVIVTQNGVPIGVILNLDLFKQLRELARVHIDQLYAESHAQESDSSTPSQGSTPQ